MATVTEAAPRWTSSVTAQLARIERDELIELVGAEFPHDLVELMGQIDSISESPSDDRRQLGDFIHD